MNLLEYQAKKLLKDFGFEVPMGRFVNRQEEVESACKGLGEQVVLKAQVPTGHRGKAGGVMVVNRKNVNSHSKKLFDKRIEGFLPHGLLIEEYLDLGQEWYLSINLERSIKGFEVIFSKSGGMDIEEIHENHPESVVVSEFPLEDIFEKELKELILSLFKFAKEHDAILVEINPLIVCPDGRKVMADAKIIIDESALYRQEKIKEMRVFESALEKEAESFDLAYVEMQGDIAVIGNGAGLVMATLDMIEHFGGRAANFCDVGGGADKEHVLKAMDLVLRKEGIKGILINIFGGITRCDEVASGIVQYKKDNHLVVPMVVRMVGTNQEEGRKILLDDGIVVRDSMEEAGEEIIHLS